MTEQGTWFGDVPGVDVNRPNAARMYDYYLGGSANFEVDRVAAEDGLSVMPHARTYARANRAFLGRAVRFLAERGVDQFLDLGSGIPTVGNVHELAPSARVAYVDVEPVAVAHARALLADRPNVSITQADIRDPESVLTAPGVTELLDLARPVAVLAVAILPFIPDDEEVASVVAAYRDACAPGSYLAVSHISQVSVSDEQLANTYAVMNRTPTPVKWRTPDEIHRLLAGYTLLEPGVVLTPDWRPDSGDTPEWLVAPESANAYAAVGEIRR